MLSLTKNYLDNQVARKQDNKNKNIHQEHNDISKANKIMTLPLMAHNGRKIKIKGKSDFEIDTLSETSSQITLGASRKLL